MILEKNSTDKKKYVFHTQLEKGNFSVFEENEFNDVMDTYRTSGYYSFEAILKYFGTLSDKKNGTDILKEKLNYLKSKGFSFSRDFNTETRWDQKYNTIYVPVSPMNKVLSSPESYKKDIYNVLFEEISKELLASNKMRIPLEELVRYRDYENFVSSSGFIHNFLQNPQHHHEITRNAILSILKKDKTKISTMKVVELLDIYLTNNPHDNKIWADIFTDKESEIYYFKDLINMHLLNKEDSENVKNVSEILHSIKNARTLQTLPYVLGRERYTFINDNIEAYYDIENDYLKKTLIKALLETNITVQDSEKMKNVFVEILKDYELANRFNERAGKPYSLCTSFDGKNLLEIVLDDILEKIQRESRGYDSQRHPAVYLRIDSEIKSNIRDIIDKFYTPEDNVIINTSLLENMNINIIPVFIGKLLKELPEKIFELDIIHVLNKYKSLEEDEFSEERKKRVLNVFYDTYNKLLKYINKHPEFIRNSTFLNSSFFNDFLKEKNEFGETSLKMKTELFEILTKNNVLNIIDKTELAHSVISEVEWIRMKNLHISDNLNDKIAIIEKFLLTNDVEKDMEVKIKTNITRI